MKNIIKFTENALEKAKKNVNKIPPKKISLLPNLSEIIPPK